MKQRLIWAATLLVVLLLVVVASCVPAATPTPIPAPEANPAPEPNSAPATPPTSTPTPTLPLTSTQRQRTNGTLTKINGNTLTLHTAQGSVTVNISSDNTTIQNIMTGTLSDLHEGQSLTVMGPQDTNGNVTAISIIIQTQSQGAPPKPPSGS